MFSRLNDKKCGFISSIAIYAIDGKSTSINYSSYNYILLAANVLLFAISITTLQMTNHSSSSTDSVLVALYIARFVYNWKILAAFISSNNCWV